MQLSPFDEHNLTQIASPDYPGERLIACYNPLLADQRKPKREELLAATEQELERIAADTRRPLTAATIGVKLGRVLNHFQVAALSNPDHRRRVHMVAACRLDSPRSRPGRHLCDSHE